MRWKRPFRSMQEVLAFLGTVTDYEKEARVRYTRSNFDLDNLRRLLAAAGDPHRRFKSIHIAGTKGKGSTAIMTAAILNRAGYRVGLYTSPHLLDMRERIQIDGRMIGERQFVDAANALRSAVAVCRHPPTYFDCMTSIAFLVFAKRKVDFAVIETGLGGRLDSTNVVTPVISGITRIDYDHTDKLGTTLAAIAGEKAGIIKPGVPVVSAPQRRAAGEVIRRTARRMNAPLAAVGREIRVTIRPGSAPTVNGAGNMLQFDVETPAMRLRSVRLPVRGRHQIENAAVAVGLVRRAAGSMPATIRSALASVALPGRIEVVSRRPLVVVDVAHNPISLKALVATVRVSFSWRRCVLIFGCLGDKDVRTMTSTVMEIADIAIMTRPDSRRAVDPRALASMAAGMSDAPVLAVPEIGRAEAVAKATAREGDMILATGSFYLAGDVIRLMRSST